MTQIDTPKRHQVRSALRALARSSALRPSSARRAARDFQQPLWRGVFSEIRWAFQPPYTWLSGLLVNLILAGAWLLVQPLAAAHGNPSTPHYHHNQLDWVVVVSTYFSSFILADVTTTNLLGADYIRVEKGLSDGVPFWRVLLIKNLALITLVGLPTLAAAAALTISREGVEQMNMTIPNVVVPIVTWIGVGNVISVVHPVRAEPLLRRWRQRRDARGTAYWLLAITLPYALYYLADPMDGVEHQLLWTQVPAMIGPVLGRDTKSYVHLGIALVVWVLASVFAVVWVRRRGLWIK